MVEFVKKQFFEILRNSVFYKFFVLLRFVSKQKIMSIEQFVQGLSNLKVKIGHIFNCIENPIHLKIGLTFN